MSAPLHRQGQREVNNAQVLRALLKEGALSRVDLAHHTGLTTAAISHITRELIESGLVHEVGKAHHRRVGAAAILLDFPLETPLIGVVHQAITTLRVGLCNLRGQVLVRRVLETPHRYAPDHAIDTIVQELQSLLSEVGRSEEDLLGIGAGLSGLVNSERGLVKRAPSLGWEDVPFRDLLAKRISCPIVIENNVRGMAFGEALFGEGRNWSDFAFLYLGIGIGAGLIIHGYPYYGAHDGAGEIGHMIVEPDGEPCTCGNRGCLETVSSEPAIARYAQQRGLIFSASQQGPKHIVRELALRAAEGDQAACGIIENCGEWLGAALTNLVDLFNPGRIVLHGTLTLAGEVFFSAVSQCIQRRAFLARDEMIELVLPTFGDDAGLVGAAAIALDALVLQGSAAYRKKSRRDAIHI